MISNKMQEALSKQIRMEMESGYIYLAMANDLHSIDMHGCARWMEKQAQEELKHAKRIYDAVQEFDGTVTFYAISQPDVHCETIREVFEKALAHEKKVTASINELVNLAMSEKDHATHAMLEWFVKEQVEEENQVMDILHRLKLAGDHGGALYFLDRELGERKES